MGLAAAIGVGVAGVATLGSAVISSSAADKAFATAAANNQLQGDIYNSNKDLLSGYYR
jgi:F0F1-type ATP synthase membrane subunit c/vacuolar-type H+-ATPase subunit K